MIVWVNVVLRRIVMTLTDVSTTWAEVIIRVKVVNTSVNVITNSPSQDYTYLDDHNLPTYDMSPGFKPVTHYNYKSVVS